MPTGPSTNCLLTTTPANRRALFSIILFLVASTPSWAQSSTAPGRLFFTPEKRAALDRQRQLNVEVVQAIEGETLSLDGIVQRSDGQRTVWINRRAQSETDTRTGGMAVKTRPRHPGEAELIISEQGGTRLKVGETVNRSTGEYDNRLGGGKLEARPSR